MKKIILLFIMPLAVLMADFTLTGGQLVWGTNSPQTSSVETGGIPPEITGTIYYVANNGDDSNNGTSESTPWKTIGKVAASSFSPGDGILFKRGDTFSVNEFTLKSGSSSGYVVFSAYGTGVKPIITTAVNKNSTSDWTEYSTNKWQTTTVVNGTTKLAQVVLNGESSPKLVFNNDTGGISSQGEHCHNESTGVTTIYSVGNPATYYDDIKVSPAIRGFRPNGRGWFIIDGLHFTHMNYGIVGVGGIHDFKIRNNKFSWIGGGLAGSTKRLGNGMEIWGTQTNGEIYYNELYQCYDTAISSQYTGSSSSHMKNISVHHNIMHDNGCHYEYYNRSSDGSSTNMTVDNNVMFDAGGWKMGQAGYSTSWGQNVILWSHRDNSVSHNGFYFRNNIMWGNWNDKEDIGGGWSSGFTFRNNTYTKASSTFGDASNLIGNPLFVDEANLNFHLQSGSNAIGNGLDLGYTRDIDGINITQSNNSIGVYATP